SVTGETIRYGATCSYSQSYTNYQTQSTSATITAATTLSLDLPRNTYTLTVTAGSNTSSATGGGTYRWGQTVTVGVTKASNTTCISYATPTWSRTSGSGTLNATSGTSVTFTMTTSNATVTATSSASNIAQTVTLSRSTGASGINIAGTNYTSSSVSLNCGTYNISGNYSTNYEFSSWSRANGVAVANTGANSTTMTVSGAGTLTLNAKSSKVYIQDLTLANCPTGGMTVYDKRDEKTYTVKKINSYCWMTQNLRFTGTSVPTATSNVTANKTLTYYSLDSSNAGSFGAYSGHCNGTNGYNYACIYDSGSTEAGVWYNYYAATAGTVSSDSNSTAASQDICPKNWHLPTGSNTTSGTEINNLVGNTTSRWQAATTGLTAFGAVAGGTYLDGSLYSAELGYWWSATASNNTIRHYLAYNSSNGQFNGNGNGSRNIGYFVRCVRTS
ncbi:hypothetical protein IJJ39_01385, partial [Candidatus Saccharibacteria bacterium]|nr:hypothetical protein [Candidatus Saccharibacteria bacterium]